MPDQAQIEERRLKSQQKAAERKKRKELLELRIQQEEQLGCKMLLFFKNPHSRIN